MLPTPPNNKWSTWIPQQDGSSVRAWWNGTRYVPYYEIDGEPDWLIQNPDWAGTNDLEQGAFDIVATVKRFFQSVTYDISKRRRNTIYMLLSLVAVVFRVLVYTKKIRI